MPDMNPKLAKAASLFVNTSTPITIRMIPIIILKYFRNGPVFEINERLRDKNNPVNKNGIPRPIE